MVPSLWLCLNPLFRNILLLRLTTLLVPNFCPSFVLCLVLFILLSFDFLLFIHQIYEKRYNS